MTEPPLSSEGNEAGAPTPQRPEATTASRSALKSPPLPLDWTSTWLVLFVAAAMGFLASLGVAVASGADALARSWTDDLSSRATVVVLSDPDDAQALAAALAAVRRVDGVASAQPLDDLAMAGHVAQWLGDEEAVTALSLPRMIDVGAAPGAQVPVAAIEAALESAGVAAEVDAHGEWVDRLAPAARAVRRLAQSALVLIGVSAALTVALACFAGLAAQSAVIDVLKLVGAEDGYISRIFVRRLQFLAFGGSAIGAALAAAALLWNGGSSPEIAATAAPELAPLLPSLRPQAADWARFTAIPLVFALIATLAAHLAVGVALRRRVG